jgi:zinc transporter
MKDWLIHALGDSGNKGAVHFQIEQVKEWQPDDGILWAHFDATRDETLTYLKRDSGIPGVAAEALVARETRPRCSMIGNALLVVLRGVNLDPGADPEDMVSIRMLVEEKRIISAQQRQLLSVNDACESLQQKPPDGTPDILLRILGRLVERINRVIDALEDRAADLENDVMEATESDQRAELSSLRREAIMLRRYLAPQREALGRMLTELPSWFGELDRLRLREIYDRQVRLVEDLDSVRERLGVIHEELVSRLSDQLNKRMYVLSIVAALFLPLSFLTGLLGINVAGIPGEDYPHAFWVFTGMLVVLIAFQMWFFVRKKWF